MWASAQTWKYNVGGKQGERRIAWIRPKELIVNEESLLVDVDSSIKEI